MARFLQFITDVMLFGYARTYISRLRNKRVFWETIREALGDSYGEMVVNDVIDTVVSDIDRGEVSRLALVWRVGYGPKFQPNILALVFPARTHNGELQLAANPSAVLGRDDILPDSVEESEFLLSLENAGCFVAKVNDDMLTRLSIRAIVEALSTTGTRTRRQGSDADSGKQKGGRSD